MRLLPVWLLCTWAFVAGGAVPLILGNLREAQYARSAVLVEQSTEALRNLSAACDRRDAAYRNKGDAQDALIAEMRMGIAVRDRVIASAQTLALRRARDEQEKGYA